MTSRTLRYLGALNEAYQQAMERDADVFVIGEDIRANIRGATRDLWDRFGSERVLDTPISEAAYTGFATGAAMAGMRVIVDYQIPAMIYPAFDQMINQAVKLRFMSGGQTRVPVTYVLMGTGARPGGGAAGQHSDSPYAYLLQSGMKVVVPSTPYDMKGLVMAAIRDDDPVAVCVPAVLFGARGDVPVEPYTIPLGRGEVKREGHDVTVVAVGHLVPQALKVAAELAPEGIDVQVWDPRSLLPLDRDGLLAAVRHTGRVVVYDDANHTCGFGAELVATIAEGAHEALRAPIRRVTRSDVPVPFSVPLETEVLATPQKLVAAVRACAQFAHS